MYLWFSLDVDEYFTNIKKEVKQVKKALGIHYGSDELPSHISLKISFLAPSGKEENIIQAVEEFYSTLHPFQLKVKEISYDKNILWIRYYDNEYLKSIGKALNEMLNTKYNIPYHEFDLDYTFHTTLFMCEDDEKIKQGYEIFKDKVLPKEVYIHRLFIGYSLDGSSDSYKILKEINMKNA